jgi:hypothetical protein
VNNTRVAGCLLSEDHGGATPPLTPSDKRHQSSLGTMRFSGNSCRALSLVRLTFDKRVRNSIQSR